MKSRVQKGGNVGHPNEVADLQQLTIKLLTIVTIKVTNILVLPPLPCLSFPLSFFLSSSFLSLLILIILVHYLHFFHGYHITHYHYYYFLIFKIFLPSAIVVTKRSSQQLSSLVGFEPWSSLQKCSSLTTTPNSYLIRNKKKKVQY